MNLNEILKSELKYEKQKYINLKNNIDNKNNINFNSNSKIIELNSKIDDLNEKLSRYLLN